MVREFMHMIRKPVGISRADGPGSVAGLLLAY